jgi:hypothetical protein
MTVIHANFPRLAEPPAPTRPLDELVRAHPSEVFLGDSLDEALGVHWWWLPNALMWCALAAVVLVVVVVLAPLAARWFV